MKKIVFMGVLVSFIFQNMAFAGTNLGLKPYGAPVAAVAMACGWQQTNIQKGGSLNTGNDVIDSADAPKATTAGTQSNTVGPKNTVFHDTKIYHF